MGNKQKVNDVLRALQVDPGSVGRLLDFLPYPFLIATKENGVHRNRFINKRFQEEIGFTLTEICTVDDWFLYAYPDDQYREFVKSNWDERQKEALRLGEDSVFSRARIHTRSKGFQWYEVKSTFTGEYEFVAFVNVNDVIERDLELERMNENKNKMLSILGHDLRSPIVNLNRLTDFMLHASLTTDEFMEHVNKVHELSKSSLQFMETTLLWTRSNFEHITPKRETLHLHEWLNTVFSFFQYAIDKKQIILSNEIPEEVVLITDTEILHIVIRNLLSNAVKFSRPNTRIRIMFNQDNHTRSITVCDSGAGMEQRIIDDIMSDKFDASHVHQHDGGFGIGLRLCKDVLKRIGGELKIASVAREGTSVSIVLPLV